MVKKSSVSIYPVKKNQVPNNFRQILPKNDSKNEESTAENPLTFTQKMDDIANILNINSKKFGNIVKSHLPQVSSNKFGNEIGNNVKSQLPPQVSITKSKINFAKMKPNQRNNSAENQECYFCTMCYENSTFKSANPGNVRKHIGKKHATLKNRTIIFNFTKKKLIIISK